jgi:hypothetical protein
VHRACTHQMFSLPSACRLLLLDESRAVSMHRAYNKCWSILVGRTKGPNALFRSGRRGVFSRTPLSQSLFWSDSTTEDSLVRSAGYVQCTALIAPCKGFLSIWLYNSALDILFFYETFHLTDIRRCEIIYVWKRFHGMKCLVSPVFYSLISL